MKMRVIVSILIVSSLLVALTGTVAGASESKLFEKNSVSIDKEPAFVDGEFLVKFTTRASDKAIDELNAKQGCRVRYVSPLAGFRIVEIPPGRTVSEMVKTYSRAPIVEYAQPNYVCDTDWAPDDDYYSDQWNFQMINMESAWNIELGGDVNVIVAVLDTGVAYEDYQEFIDNPGRRQDYWKTYQQAPDLEFTNFVSGYDFINNDIHPNDDDSHGTHVTGTIAQSTNNAYGVAGVAFNTSIMPVKVLDSNGSGTVASLADGIRYAANNGADIINMSLGFPSSVKEADVPALTAAVDYAYDNGVIQVASSGNNGGGVVSLPAAYDHVIAVGAVNSADERASYSQYGTDLEVVAPGGDDVDRDGDGYIDGVLQETFNPNTRDTTDFGFWFFSGTSMAAPHTSGLIALLLAQDPGRTLTEIRDILRNSSVDLGNHGWDVEYGYGRIDALAALGYAAVPNEPPVAEAGGPYTGDEGSPLTFDASGSSDIDGVITLYEWDWDNDGVFEESTTVSTIAHTWSEDRAGTVGLRVKDNDGATATDTATVSVADLDPTADFSYSPTNPVPGESVYFTDESTSHDGITSWLWDFGNETGSTLQNPTCIFKETGTYTVTLTVKEDDLGSATAVKDMVVVVSEVKFMHIASIDIDTETRTAGRNTFTNAVATLKIVDAADNPVEGATVSGQWSRLTGDLDSGLTDADGVVVLKSDAVKNKSGTFTFTVSDVVLSEWIYESSTNGDFDGDGLTGDISNSITI